MERRPTVCQVRRWLTRLARERSWFEVTRNGQVEPDPVVAVTVSEWRLHVWLCGAFLVLIVRLSVSPSVAWTRDEYRQPPVVRHFSPRKLGPRQVSRKKKQKATKIIDPALLSFHSNYLAYNYNHHRHPWKFQFLICNSISRKWKWSIYISCRDSIFISNSRFLPWKFDFSKKETTAWSMIVYLWTSIKIPILRNRV